MTAARTVDRTAGWLGVAFLVTLLASEAALSLPDRDADTTAVATFYASHRTAVIVLQMVGLASCVLLALFAWRLRAVDRAIAGAGLTLAVAALAPVVITTVLALTSDVSHPSTAGTYNRLEPRGDDLLFLAVAAFALVVAGVLWRPVRWLAVVAAVVAVCCLLRLVLEIVGHPRGALELLAPLSFLVLVAALTLLSFRGFRHLS